MPPQGRTFFSVGDMPKRLDTWHGRNWRESLYAGGDPSLHLRGIRWQEHLLTQRAVRVAALKAKRQAEVGLYLIHISHITKYRNILSTSVFVKPKLEYA